MDNTVSQHVHKRATIKVTVTEVEVANVEAKYDHQYDFCRRNFKINRVMLIHRASCMLNYATSDEVFAVKEIVGVFGHKDTSTSKRGGQQW